MCWLIITYLPQANEHAQCTQQTMAFVTMRVFNYYFGPVSFLNAAICVILSGDEVFIMLTDCSALSRRG